MSNRQTKPDREQAIRFGILPEENVPHWSEIEAGRFQPGARAGAARPGTGLNVPRVAGTGDKQPG
jgi:hypothetical protein